MATRIKRTTCWRCRRKLVIYKLIGIRSFVYIRFKSSKQNVIYICHDCKDYLIQALSKVSPPVRPKSVPSSETKINS